MNWQKEDGEECERVCITKNHKSSLVQWAPITQPGSLSDELQAKKWEGIGSSSCRVTASLRPGKPFTSNQILPEVSLTHSFRKNLSSECLLCAKHDSRCYWGREWGSSTKMNKIQYLPYYGLDMFMTETLPLPQHKQWYVIGCSSLYETDVLLSLSGMKVNFH